MPICGFTTASLNRYEGEVFRRASKLLLIEGTLAYNPLSTVEDNGTNRTDNGGAVGGGGVFATTRWTIVLAAQQDSEPGRQALEQLCHTYWFPVYAVVRRQGFDPETAADFTQEFFAKLLSRDGLATVRRERGRFRSFLAQCVKNFLADEWDKARAQKRGGGLALLSLDAEAAEGRYREAAHSITPESEFDRQWAEQLLAAARSRLQQEFNAAGKAPLLEVLDHAGDPNATGLAEAAARMNVPLNTLKSHLRRARLRHAEILREIIAETVATPADVEAELRELLAAISE